MKNLKALLAVGLFAVGLGFTSCSSDDKYIDPNPPSAENPIWHEKPVHLPGGEAVQPLP